MKKLLLGFLSFIIFSLHSTAQFNAPDIIWQKELGGPADDGAYSVGVTSDGGFIVAGYAGYAAGNDGDIVGNHSGRDFWIVKLDANGSFLWKHAFGGAGDDVATSIKQASDGGFIVAGYTGSGNSGDVPANHGGVDFWILKLDATGEIIPTGWSHTFGGTMDDKAYAVQETNDGNYIVAGETASNNYDVKNNHGASGTIDCWVVQISYSGILQYARAIGGSGADNAYAIEQNPDSGFVIAGSSTSNDGDILGDHHGTINDDAWIAVLNNLSDSLTPRHARSLGGTNTDDARAVQRTLDGGYIVAGYSNSNDGDVIADNHGGFDCWIVKLDSTLSSIEWAKSYGGSGDDKAYAIQQTDDSGYVFLASSNSIDGDITGGHGNEDFWIVKIDKAGNIKWQRTMGGTGDDYGFAFQQIPSPDDGFIVAGQSNSSDGDAAIGGSLDHANSNDYWVLRLTAEVGIEEKNSTISAFDISPNPVSHTANISFSLSEPENVSIKIYDITGREVKSIEHEDFSKGLHNLVWNVNDLVDNGMYLLTLQTASGYSSKKVAVIK